MKYIYHINTLNLSVILEWRRQFQMVNHTNYNLNVNEDFAIFLTFKLITCFIDGFTSRINEIPIKCLFTNWKCTYILDFRSWRWSALNMGFVVKQPSRMQGQCFFFKLGGVDNNFQSGSKFSREGCPRPDLTTPIVRKGGLNVHLYVKPLIWLPCLPGH